MNRESSSHALRSILLPLALLASPGLVAAGGEERQQGASSPEAVPCGSFRNGGFEHGVSGWRLESWSGGFGEIIHYAEARVCNATHSGGDEDMLCMNVFVVLDDVSPNSTGSAAQAEVTLARRVVVTDRFLEFEMLGGFGLCGFGVPAGRLAGTLVVTDASGHSAEQTFFEQEIQFQKPCGAGVCASGILPTGTVSMDLVSAGFAIGQDVSIEIAWSVTMVALNACNVGDFGGGLFVDDFRLCDVATTTALASARRREFPVESRSAAGALPWSLLAPEDQMLLLRDMFPPAEEAHADHPAPLRVLGEVEQ